MGAVTLDASSVVVGLIASVMLVIGGVVGFTRWLGRKHERVVEHSVSITVGPAVTAAVTSAIAPVLAEFSKNSGKSAKDQWDRIETIAINANGIAASALGRINEHVAYHEGRESVQQD